MNVLAIVPSLKAPSCRFRILQYVAPLKKEGIHFEVVELSQNEKKRWSIFNKGGDYDAVLLHRKLLNWIDCWKLRRSARRIVYDFDDAVMFRDSNAPQAGSRSRRKKFQKIVSLVDLVIAGNTYLADWARRYNPRTITIPTVVDLSPYPREPVIGSGNVIGWSGTKSNLIYLQLVTEALQTLCQNKPEIQFKLLCDGELEIPGVSVIEKMFSLEEEVADLLSFDVGIMPLFSDVWTEGKCSLKILCYYSAFLPVVCSPVGNNLEVVQEGVSGFFARSPEEWRNRLEELLASPEKREKMGRAGRKLVEEKYCLDVMVPRMAEALKQVIR